MLWVWVGWESCRWKFSVISELGKQLWFPLLKCCDISFHTCEKAPQYHTLLNRNRSIYTMPFDGASLRTPRGSASFPILEVLSMLNIIRSMWAFSTPQILLALGCHGNCLVSSMCPITIFKRNCNRQTRSAHFLSKNQEQTYHCQQKKQISADC